jgi:hypothetical protein
MDMEIPDVLAIKGRLLDQSLRLLLQIYCDRYSSDPQFLSLYRSSVISVFRHVLRLEIRGGDAERDKTTQAEVDEKIFEALTQAVRERAAERNNAPPR